MPNKNVTQQQRINEIHHQHYFGHVSVVTADAVAKKQEFSSEGVIHINSDVLKPSTSSNTIAKQHIQIPWSTLKTNTTDGGGGGGVCVCVCVCLRVCVGCEWIFTLFQLSEQENYGHK